MFKKKQKKSHKNDEIYVDYSKDIDVKKQEEDQAKPEHYKALEVKDDIVVSTGQIKEAKQQQLQDKFIKQREEQRKLEELQNLNEKEPEDAVDTALKEEPLQDEYIPEENIEEEPEEVLEQKSSYVEKEAFTDKVEEPHNQDPSLAEESEESYQKEEFKNVQDNKTIYPSFLSDEFEHRRKPISQSDLPIDQEDSNKEIDRHKEESYEEEEHVQVLKEDDLFEETEESEEVSTEKKQDLHSYFQVDSSVLKSGVKSADYKMRPQKEKKEPLYRYKQQSFYSMDEFVAFLEKNTIHLEHIAHDILKDEQFFRWLKEESNLFEESIIKMKKFKEDLKQ